MVYTPKTSRNIIDNHAIIYSDISEMIIVASGLTEAATEATSLRLLRCLAEAALLKVSHEGFPMKID